MRSLRATILTFAVLLGAATLAGCSVDQAVAPAPPRLTTVSGARGVFVSPFPEPVIRAQLALASDGLLYTSESDYPFTWFTAALPPVQSFASPLTIATMRTIVGAPADAPAEVISLDAFFARHIENVDPYDSVAVALVPRYVNLRETLRHTLPGVQVFRIGAIQVHCYAVGLDRERNVVGLETVAIET